MTGMPRCILRDEVCGGYQEQTRTQSTTCGGSHCGEKWVRTRTGLEAITKSHYISQETPGVGDREREHYKCHCLMNVSSPHVGMRSNANVKAINEKLADDIRRSYLLDSTPHSPPEPAGQGLAPRPRHVVRKRG